MGSPFYISVIGVICGEIPCEKVLFRRSNPSLLNALEIASTCKAIRSRADMSFMGSPFYISVIRVICGEIPCEKVLFR
jgi:hypothetical protein